MKNQQRADGILKAVSEYEQDHGQFPVQLDLLVPDYLSEVPLAVGNNEFVYEINKIDGFLLSFHLTSKRQSYCTYIERFESWDCGFYVVE